MIKSSEMEEYQILRYNKKMRYQILTECGYALGDMVSLTVSLPSLIIPTRTTSYMKLLYLLVAFPCFECQTTFKYKYGNCLRHYYLWLGCIKNLGYAVLDLFGIHGSYYLALFYLHGNH